MKRTLKEIVITLCCSYTVVVALNSFLYGEDYAMHVNATALRQLFWICLTTAVLINIVLRINYSKAWISYVVSLLTMFTSIFGIGTFVFHIIPLRADVYISVVIMSSFIYLLCKAMAYAIEKNEADEINEKLNQKFRYHKEEHHG